MFRHIPNDKIVLYSWDELVAKYSSFTNHEYWDTQEIKIPRAYEYFYLNEEYRQHLGKGHRMYNYLGPDKGWLDNPNLPLICGEMVKEIASIEDYPELYI